MLLAVFAVDAALDAVVFAVLAVLLAVLAVDTALAALDFAASAVLLAVFAVLFAVLAVDTALLPLLLRMPSVLFQTIPDNNPRDELFCIYRVLAHPSTYGRRVDYAKISGTV